MNQTTAFKNAIITHLTTLKNNQTIGNFYTEDLSKDVLEGIYTNFPVIILGMSNNKPEPATWRTNISSITAKIYGLQKVTNINKDGNATDMEDLVDNIMSEFANDLTYGLGNGWVEAPQLELEPISTPDKDMLAFIISITAHIAKDLNFII